MMAEHSYPQMQFQEFVQNETFFYENLCRSMLANPWSVDFKSFEKLEWIVFQIPIFELNPWKFRHKFFNGSLDTPPNRAISRIL